MSKKHEMGTDEYLKYLQSETPGELETNYNESVEEFIREVKKAKDDQKKKHFSMTFDNPLKGFPYNEQFGFDKNLQEIEEALESMQERINFHKKSPAEKSGSEFDRKKEINGYKKILKTVEKLNKDHEKFQYNNRAAQGPDKIFKGLQAVESACYDMIRQIESGKWDGKVDLED